MSGSEPRPTSRERLLELLADRAIGALSPMEELELERLLEREPGVDRDDLDLLVAELLTEVIEEPAPLSDPLRQRVLDEAAEYAERVGPARDDREARVIERRGSWVGRTAPWAIAAAAVLSLVWFAPIVDRGDGGDDVPLGANQARTLLLQADPNAIQLAWSKTEDPTSDRFSAGDVIWSETTQTGYMRFEGLEPNDPADFQYQLWIFDADRDERYPVDGGVFDVDSTSDVVVPIRARLDVAQPTLFAVTVEQPGGVVVSSRERITLVASVP